MIRQFSIFLLASLTWLSLFAQEESGSDAMDTVFTGDYLEMISGDEISEFHLTGNVTVTGTNLELSSDELHITAVKEGDKEATVTRMGKIMKIIAVGNVKVYQEGRTAESGKAEFFPEERKVLLTENPIVTDEQGTVSGEEIEWFHGQRRAQVRGGKNKVVVTLPTLPNLGYDPEDEDTEEDAASNSLEESEDAPIENPINP